MTIVRDSVCSYCGLPLLAEKPRDAIDTAWVRESTDDPPRFCCFGCRIAAGLMRDQDPALHDRSLTMRLGFAVFLSMNVMVLTMFLWSQTSSSLQEARAVLLYDLARYGCMILSTIVLGLLAEPLCVEAWTSLERGRASMSILLLAGTLAAYGYSVVSVFRGGGDVYFEVTCMVLVITTLGKCLEAAARQKTTMALRSLHGLLPATARRVRGDEESVVPTGQLQPGDVIRILPGERIPVDGMLLGGPAWIDEQVVTGESLPIEKEHGAAVQAGTLSVDGEIRIEATSRADEGFLRKTVDAILRGVATKTRFERLADRISAGFFPLVVVLAIATWIMHTWNGDAGRGGLAALAVLVIACPCALGLATPMALWAAVGRAAQMQTIVRDPEALIQLSKATDFCFDKTGTLTTGVANVEAFRCEDPGESDRCLQISAALARGSTHPLAEALSHYVAQRCDRVAMHASQIRVVPGKGIEATVDDIDGPCYLGSRRWLQSLGCAVPEPWADALRDGSEVCLAWQHRIRAVFRFSQALREDAPMVLEQLGQRGRVIVLTGDRRPYAEQQLQGCKVDMLAELLPQQKAERIRERSMAGGRVVMVGDGLNDGPALASATVGVAMGCGTDLSRASSSICLLSDDLSKIPQLVEFSDAVNRVIIWNLVWAFVYNIGGIALAAIGIVNPIVAAIIMVVSSLLVVTNSLRLANWLPAAQRRSRPSGDFLNETDVGLQRQQADAERNPAVTNRQHSRLSASTSSDPGVASANARRDSAKEFSESLS